jgi:hypothetical protein
MYLVEPDYEKYIFTVVNLDNLSETYKFRREDLANEFARKENLIAEEKAKENENE